jgi:hypothetical protein
VSAALDSGCQVAAQRFRPRKPLRGLFIGLFYGVALSAGALLCAGPGDGTYTPFVWSSAPLLLLGPKVALLLTPVFWAACGLLPELKQTVWRRALLPVLLLAHYTTAIILTFNERFYDFGKLAECLVLVIPFAAVYLAGQTLLWMRIARRFTRVNCR